MGTFQYFLLVLVVSCVPQEVKGQCDVTEATSCIEVIGKEIKEGKGNAQTLCRQAVSLTSRLNDCTNDMSGCTASQTQTVTDAKTGAAKELDNTCSDLSNGNNSNGNTTKVCSNEDVQTRFEAKVGACKAAADTWTRFEVNGRILQQDICDKVQEKLDCLYAAAEGCGAMTADVDVGAVADVKFAHLFGCAVAAKGKQIKPSGCNLYDWLRCYDPVFEKVAFQTVESGKFDLKLLRDGTNTAIFSALMKDASRPSKCSEITVSWESVKTCRGREGDKCAAFLDTPRDDLLWQPVRGLLTALHQWSRRIRGLEAVQQYCDSSCDGIEAKQSTISSTCVPDISQKADAVLSKYKQKVNNDATCAELQAALGCYSREKGNCPVLEEKARFDFNSHLVWKLASSICDLDIGVTQSETACGSALDTQKDSIKQILPESVGSTYIREALLNNGITNQQFCAFVQTNVLAELASEALHQCHELELAYFLPFHRFAGALNQMLGCTLNLQAYDGVPLGPVQDATCMFKDEVDCMKNNGLLQALGVTPSDNGLDVAGVQQLLRIVWHYADTRRDYCSALGNVKWNSLAKCVKAARASCRYPMFTLSDGKSPDADVRSPLDVDFLRQLNNKLCASSCRRFETKASELQQCYSNAGDNSIMQTLAPTILFNFYTRQDNKQACSELKSVKRCVNDKLQCPVLERQRSSIVQAPDFSEAEDICNARAPDGTSTDPRSTAASAQWSVLALAVLSTVALGLLP